MAFTIKTNTAIKESDTRMREFFRAFPSCKENEPMSAHTYLKIGGPARLYLVAYTAEELVRAVESAMTLAIPWRVLGGGSNLLVSDKGFQGVVIQAADRTTSINGTCVVVAPGALTALVARIAADAGLTGFEWGIGLPGTVGGATYGNAGCFGGSMQDVITFVETYDITRRDRITLSHADCQFAYRDSRFKHESHVILSTTLALQPGDPSAARRKLVEIMGRRKDTQPQGTFSAGCLFKNFEFRDEGDLEELRRAKGEIPPEFFAAHHIPAGWLIEKLGLKGKTIGRAQVSAVHGNFIVNLGGARAKDVIALSSYVKLRVRDELGILLEDEVQYLGF